MPAERVSMRQIREVLRLRFASELPQRAIAKSLGLSQGTVSGYLSRARAAGVSWPFAEDLDDAQLEALLFPPPPAIAADQRPMPDWAWVHRELRRPNVTLALLWEEYRASAPDGFGYSWFCDLYRGWAGRLQPTMRQTHIVGEKLFVDFAALSILVRSMQVRILASCDSLTTRAAISAKYVLCRRGLQTPGHPKTVRRSSSAHHSMSLDFEAEHLWMRV
jgi:transcriptional regulator with XRE-family HTH domain